MKKILGYAASIALMANVAAAAPIFWDSADGGNDHAYELVVTQEPIFWGDASNNAVASGGHLATVTSDEEWSFIEMYVNPNNLKAWLGGTDVENEGDWQWVTGEDWAFDNWANDTYDDGNWRGENYLIAWWFGDYWKDVPEGGRGYVSAYIVEYDLSQVPLPASLPLLAGGLGLLGLARRRKAKT